MGNPSGVQLPVNNDESASDTENPYQPHSLDGGEIEFVDDLLDDNNVVYVSDDGEYSDNEEVQGIPTFHLKVFVIFFF